MLPEALSLCGRDRITWGPLLPGAGKSPDSGLLPAGSKSAPSRHRPSTVCWRATSGKNPPSRIIAPGMKRSITPSRRREGGQA